jgi:hypothetical protein
MTQDSETDFADRGYAVGYGKPPVEKRFRKGRSGNPRGRPPRDLASLLAAALDKPAEGPGRRGRRRPSKREALAAALVDGALTGDGRAVRLLFDILNKHGSTEALFGEDPTESTRAEILRRLERIHASQLEEEARAQEVAGGAGI